MDQESCQDELRAPLEKLSLTGRAKAINLMSEKTSKKYKILYFFLSYPEITQAGGDFYLVQLVEKIGKNNDIVIVGSMSDYLFSKFKEYGAKIIKTPFFSKFDFFAIPKLRKIFFLEKPDVIHFNDSRARFLGALAAKTLNIKTVSIYHSSTLFYVGWFKRFFIWADDTDYCLRIKKSGGKIFYIPKAKIIRLREFKQESVFNTGWAQILFRNLFYLDLKYGSLPVKFIRPLIRIARLIIGRIFHKDFKSIKIIFASSWDVWKMYLQKYKYFN